MSNANGVPIIAVAISQLPKLVKYTLLYTCTQYTQLKMNTNGQGRYGTTGYNGVLLWQVDFDGDGIRL